MRRKVDIEQRDGKGHGPSPLILIDAEALKLIAAQQTNRTAKVAIKLHWQLEHVKNIENEDLCGLHLPVR
jgi:hypothetical protein